MNWKDFIIGVAVGALGAFFLLLAIGANVS